VTHFVLTVDPGVVTAGWALWTSERTLPGDLLRAGSVVMTRDQKAALPEWARQAAHVAQSVAFALRTEWESVCCLYCETPSVFTGSARGLAAAEDVVRVSFACGMLAQRVMRNGGRFVAVPVRDWKGQLPKVVCHRRVKKILGQTCAGLDQHSLDAVGIGLYLKGLL
jgi:hypothetical protein